MESGKTTMRKVTMKGNVNEIEVTNALAKLGTVVLIVLHALHG